MSKKRPKSASARSPVHRKTHPPRPGVDGAEESGEFLSRKSNGETSDTRIISTSTTLTMLRAESGQRPWQMCAVISQAKEGGFPSASVLSSSTHRSGPYRSPRRIAQKASSARRSSCPLHTISTRPSSQLSLPPKRYACARNRRRETHMSESFPRSVATMFASSHLRLLFPHPQHTFPAICEATHCSAPNTRSASVAGLRTSPSTGWLGRRRGFLRIPRAGTGREPLGVTASGEERRSSGAGPGFGSRGMSMCEGWGWVEA